MRGMESPARAASALIAIGCCASAWADVRLPPAFADGMVLQRDRPIHVHGSAQPNEEVMVELRDASGAVVRSGRTVTGQGGRFTLDLPAMPGSPDALELEVRGANTVTVRDVVMGDVWVAGGQSNMEWPVAATGAQSKAAVAAADDPMIRVLKVPHETAGRPKSVADVRWQKASAETVPSMSAVAFWFAKDIRARTGVPVGIISTNWGGTRAEPWVDLATLGADPAFTDRVAELRERVEQWNEVPADERERIHQAAMRDFQSAGTQWWTDVNAAEPGIEGKWMLPDTAVDGPEWEDADLPMRWSDHPRLREHDGVCWYRRTVEIPATWTGKECFLELGAIDDADIAFIDGRAVANTIADWTTSRRYRIPASLVKGGTMTVALEVMDMHGEGGVLGDPALMRIACPAAGGDPIPLAGTWRMRFGRSAADLPAPPARPSRDAAPGTAPTDPGAIYNAMIAPFAGFPVRGAIWYQGESNAGNERDAADYARLLPLVIRSWRGTFEQPDMPFGIVSLASFRPFRPDAAVSGLWPVVRDAQLQAEQSSPNTGTITTIDAGDANDIHPQDKRTVGERLARWAAAATYRAGDVVWRGPRTKGIRRDADGVLVDFDTERGRLATRDGKPPASLAIAGADGKFLRAEAELVPPNGLRVRHPDVPVPMEVRYAWQDNPADANLIDEVSRLPAHPFRITVPADPVQPTMPAPAPVPAASSGAPR
jgi:sialate O-acetylesterase